MERITIDRDYLVELYEGGESVLALAARFGVARGTIDKRLDAAGVIRRGQSSASRFRYARSTAEERSALTAAAHDAARGRPRPFEEACRMALGRQRTCSFATPTEARFADWLRERGVDTVAQQAIGPYNCDLGAHPIAVELFGGNWHASGDHARRFHQRSRYVLDAGWSLVVVWDQVRDPLSVAAADEVAAFVHATRADPPAIAQYRVIRGCGEVIARGEAHDDEIPLVISQRRADRRGP